MKLESRAVGAVSGRNWHAVYKEDDGTEWVNPWPVVAIVAVETEYTDREDVIGAIVLVVGEEDGWPEDATKHGNYCGIRWIEDGQEVYVNDERPAEAKKAPTIDLGDRGQRCTATTKAGNPCNNYATWGTDPPRCGPHGGRV